MKFVQENRTWKPNLRTFYHRAIRVGRIEIRALDAKGKPVEGLPGEGGYFEMILPKALLDANSLTIDWIDFYR